jgi:hypothetical protein
LGTRLTDNDSGPRSFLR